MTGHGRTGCMRMARGSFRTPTSSKGLKPDEGDTIARDCCWNAGGGLELCPVRGGRGEDKGLCCLPRGGPEEGPSASHERLANPPRHAGRHRPARSRPWGGRW
jgi:hypothetical protein